MFATKFQLGCGSLCIFCLNKFVVCSLMFLGMWAVTKIILILVVNIANVFYNFISNQVLLKTNTDLKSQKEHKLTPKDVLKSYLLLYNIQNCVAKVQKCRSTNRAHAICIYKLLIGKIGRVYSNNLLTFQYHDISSTRVFPLGII